MSFCVMIIRLNISNYKIIEVLTAFIVEFLNAIKH